MLAKEMKHKFDHLEKEHKSKEDKLLAELNQMKQQFAKLKEEN